MGIWDQGIGVKSLEIVESFRKCDLVAFKEKDQWVIQFYWGKSCWANLTSFESFWLVLDREISDNIYTYLCTWDVNYLLFIIVKDGINDPSIIK